MEKLAGKIRHPTDIAGNNAVSTLEAMLLLMLKDYRETVKTPTWWWIKLTRMTVPELMSSGEAKLGARIVGLPALREGDGARSPAQEFDVRGMEEASPAFLLAAARWQMIRQFGQTFELTVFDVETQLLVVHAAYGAAAFAMPLCFALAPPWHVCCERH